jgi:hypothetical protein
MNNALAPSSLADWVAALAGVVTALAAVPAAAYFLLDRRQAAARRLTAQARKLDQKVLRLRINYAPETLEQGLAIRVEPVEPTDLLLGHDVDMSGKIGLEPTLTIPMLHNDQAGFYVVLTAHSPSTALTAVKVKVSLFKIPAKRPFLSRTLPISAIA